MNECCFNPLNIELGTPQRCRACGCRHFRMQAEPLVLGLTGGELRTPGVANQPPEAPPGEFECYSVDTLSIVEDAGTP